MPVSMIAVRNAKIDPLNKLGFALAEINMIFLHFSFLSVRGPSCAAFLVTLASLVEFKDPWGMVVLLIH